ncbi:MAG TPA: glutaredoxin family protein [Thermoanaerobaculia bacterium]|jgi:mycoredoxin
MSQFLDCHVYYDSTRHARPPAECGHHVDLAAEPAAAGLLARLGLSPESDLPAVLLTEPDGKVRVLGVRLDPEETAKLAAGAGIRSSNVVVYSSAWCSDCRRAKRVLEEAETRFDEVDIDRDLDAEALVLKRSGGRRVVPTLRFDDRVWAFNPAPPLLRRLLNGRAQPV